MKDRIKQVRSDAHLTQDEFAKRLKLTRNFIAQIEIGAKDAGARTIRDICTEFGVNELWLRTGDGDPYAKLSRAEEMTAEVTRLMAKRPDSFKAAVVSALLRFDPEGPEWAVLESIYESIIDETEKRE